MVGWGSVTVADGADVAECSDVGWAMDGWEGWEWIWGGEFGEEGLADQKESGCCDSVCRRVGSVWSRWCWVEGWNGVSSLGSGLEEDLC